MSEDNFYQRRLEVCNNCDKLKIKFTTRICGECGCILKVKAVLKQFKCPLDKWDKEDQDGSKE